MSTRDALEEWKEELQREARREGEHTGRTEEAARSVLTVLHARSVAVPDTARARILAEKDTDRLQRWLAKAVSAASVNEVIDEPS